jgi:mRNA-degrading endonuclease RelE of RelBE toxin-antitoxin system
MNLRIKPTLKAKLERLAKHDRRTLHAYVEKLLNDHVKRSPPARLQHQQEAKRGNAV